jgi:membrane-bound serine protease (ClpP class)
MSTHYTNQSANEINHESGLCPQLVYDFQRISSRQQLIRCIMIWTFMEVEMEFLLNPNVAYVLIVASAMLALAAIVVPGTGMPEIGLVLCLGLAAYSVYSLGINGWALLVVSLSVIPFVFALRAKTLRIPLLVFAILMLIGGSIFMFVDEKGWPVVDPVLAIIVSFLSGGFIWIAVERVLAAQRSQPSNDLHVLIGKVGEARTEINTDGSVQVSGELWSARSEKPIAAGSPVRIIQREGFVLIVEKVS